jgi:hypothetical protein
MQCLEAAFHRTLHGVRQGPATTAR